MKEGKTMEYVKEYNSSKNTVTKINNNGLHITFCKCGNQLNHIQYDKSICLKTDCNKCNGLCSGLKNQYETGYNERTVHGICKVCNTKIEY
jgi:hypothetical protein